LAVSIASLRGDLNYFAWDNKNIYQAMVIVVPVYTANRAFHAE